MRLIDPFEFRDLFRSTRSLAIVGNAPCILDWENGAAIDACDLVVRFNRARTAGHETRIGSRTDVLFVNASNSLSKAPPPTELCRPRCLVCFSSPQGARDLDPAPFREWAGDDVPLLWSFGPDLIGLPAASRTKPLTSGTYALFTLQRLFDLQRLFVTGFTMFGAVPGGAGKYWNEAVPAAAVAHDLDEEAKLFINLLASFKGKLIVTSEIQELAGKQGVTLADAGAANGKPVAKRGGLRQRIADGLAWRFLKAGMALRRIAQS